MSARRLGRIFVDHPAPEFVLQDQDGQWRSLAELRRNRACLLSFLPPLGSSGRVSQIDALKEGCGQFTGLGVAVWVVGEGRVAAHANITQQFGLPFRLLSDSRSAVRRAYGIALAWGNLVGNSTLLIDAESNVRSVACAPFNRTQHVDMLFAEAQQLKGLFPQDYCRGDRGEPCIERGC